MAWGIFSPFVGKNRPRTPIQWVKFPWEYKEPTPMIEITESETKALDNIFNDFVQRKNKHSS